MTKCPLYTLLTLYKTEETLIFASNKKSLLPCEFDVFIVLIKIECHNTLISDFFLLVNFREVEQLEVNLRKDYS